MTRLLVLFCAMVALVRGADAPLLRDPAEILPPEARAKIAVKLAAFERSAGIRVIVEFRPKSPSEKEDEVPGAFMRGLAQRYGVAERGVLAVFFADDPDWRLWIGDALTARFAGKTGTVAELTENKAIHDAKEALFANAKAKADAVDPDPKSRRRLAAETAALLDGLFARLSAR